MSLELNLDQCVEYHLGLLSLIKNSLYNDLDTRPKSLDLCPLCDGDHGMLGLRSCLSNFLDNNALYGYSERQAVSFPRIDLTSLETIETQRDQSLLSLRLLLALSQQTTRSVYCALCVSQHNRREIYDCLHKFVSTLTD